MTQEAELELEPPQRGSAASQVDFDIEQRLQEAVARATENLLFGPSECPVSRLSVSGLAFRCRDAYRAGHDGATTEVK